MDIFCMTYYDCVSTRLNISLLEHYYIPSATRQKGESQNGCYKRTKYAKFSEKQTFFTSWYTHVQMFVFWKIWCALLFCNTVFEIRSFALLPTIRARFITTWKMAHLGVFSGQYFPVLELNTEIYSVKSPYSAWAKKYTDHKNYEFGHFPHILLFFNIFSRM